MVLNLFLDANILISFYALSNADIEQLKQLKGVVAKGDIKLFISDQLSNEVERNRETKISESFKALRDSSFKCLAPSFVRSLPEFAELQDLLKDANKKHSDLIKTVTGHIEGRTLDADIIIKELIDTATVTPTTSKQISAAHRRFITGNPPGKKKSTIGDELNWEFLLSTVPDGEDLHLVSADGDYASQLESGKANGFLLSEWKNTKSADLYYYKELNDFFKLHVPKIKLANQAKLNALIVELSGSGSFSDTHSIVAKFPDDAEFTDGQIVELMNVLKNNSQVGWIATDSDVAALYAPIRTRYAELVKPDDEDPL
ncbi:PIN domain-containing protein [Sedimentimonas flavescens]|uniref:PIN domain-containing protein n=1 Tax=Sedimentimonas flavescens TaxID=2851012 RepID=A0ABT3A1C7_9RHOB|nr:PIN domain-containing protein [Sedimentimonas flavescens]MCV2879726.1 PIN domain-containing protein [Sedimentimonas flavescens]